jgi:iron-sulfur cluster assembly protein
MALPPPITITDAAAHRVKALLDQRGKESLGIRVGVKKGGCSGLAYTIEYADELQKFDEVVEEKGVKVIIDPKAIIYLIGTQMDFIDEKLKSGFVFTNPNEKGKCGCGESFHV